MGRVEQAENGRRKMRVARTYDERIEDGLYSYHALEGIRQRIENPELLELTVRAPAEQAGEGVVG